MHHRKSAPIGSAAHIRIHPKVPAATGYRELLATCGSNLNHQAIVLITALIGDGVNTRRDILDAAEHNGLKRGHVAIVLAKETGNSPHAHRWRVDEHGVYSNWPDSA